MNQNQPSNREEMNIVRVFESESGKLESFIRRFVPNREDAKDLVQDVFYNLIMGYGEIKNLEKIGAWLYNTARFKAIDFLRKKKPILNTDLNKKENNEDENIFEWLMNHSPPDQEEKLWQELVWEIVEKTLENMPQAQRDVFVMYELEGFSIQAIAEKTGVNQNTVLSRKRYAVEQLKEALLSIYKEIEL